METSIINLLVLFLLLSALFRLCLSFVLFFVPLEYFYNYWLNSIDGKLNAQNTIAITQTSWNWQHRISDLCFDISLKTTRRTVLSSSVKARRTVHHFIADFTANRLSFCVFVVVDVNFGFDYCWLLIMRFDNLQK